MKPSVTRDEVGFRGMMCEGRVVAVRSRSRENVESGGPVSMGGVNTKDVVFFVAISDHAVLMFLRRNRVPRERSRFVLRERHSLSSNRQLIESLQRTLVSSMMRGRLYMSLKLRRKDGSAGRSSSSKDDGSIKVRRSVFLGP